MIRRLIGTDECFSIAITALTFQASRTLFAVLFLFVYCRCSCAFFRRRIAKIALALSTTRTTRAIFFCIRNGWFVGTLMLCIVAITARAIGVIRAATLDRLIASIGAYISLPIAITTLAFFIDDARMTVFFILADANIIDAKVTSAVGIIGTCAADFDADAIPTTPNKPCCAHAQCDK